MGKQQEITVEDRLISIREVEKLVGLKQSAIYARMTRDEFPRGRSLGPRTVRWLHSEVKAWMAELPSAQVREADRPQGQR